MRQRRARLLEELFMQTDTNAYAARWVDGLPAGLLSIDGRTAAVITLLQKAGLNRGRRKALESRERRPVHRPDWMAPLSRTDRCVLSFFMSGRFRFNAFWAVAGEPHGFVGNMRYAQAVEVQLLDAYDRQWSKHTLNEVELVQACPVWPEVRDGIAAARASRPPASLGVFMVWLQLLSDLRSFDELDVGRRTEVAHAVFALSTIGRTEWFVDEALALRPDLTGEISLSARRVDASKDGYAAVEEIDDTEASGNADCAPDGPPNNEAEWETLVDRLAGVAHELRENPSREAVADLVALSSQFEMLSVSLPSRVVPTSNAFAAHLQELMTFLGSLAAREAFAWLEHDLVSQIGARWHLALAASNDTSLVEQLNQDARDALIRTTEVADSYLQATDDVALRRRDEKQLEVELAAAKGFAQQAAMRRRFAEAKKHHLDAEANQLARQEHLIDAASPFGEVFDYGADYESALFGTPTPDLIAEGRDISDEMVALKLGELRAVPFDGLAEITSESSARFADGEIETIAEPVLDAIYVPLSADAPPTEDSALEAMPDDTVDVFATTPIWDALAIGERGLAYHASAWLQETAPSIRVPSSDLLAATAFAEELMLPDGALHAALVSRFASIEADEFSADVNAPWHAATNLLLATATLRPMVLAPSSGAADVATYLHHDGHYPAVYALVQKLRDLSSKLVGFRIEPAVLRLARSEATTKSDLEELKIRAADWLTTQAPAYTIRFAPATAVWKQWLRPGGEIESLVSPVIHNKIQDAQRVRDALAEMANPAYIQRLITDTDRKDLRRRRGDDIYAGALDHLVRLVDEGLALPRQWLSLVELIGTGGNRLRSLLGDVHAALRDGRIAVENELTRIPEADVCGMVAASQVELLRSYRDMTALFDSTSGIPETERSPNEVLARSGLLVAELSITENWIIETAPASGLKILSGVGTSLDAEPAQRERIARGDLLGAEMMVETGLVAADTILLRPERERWRQILRKEIVECRRAVEIGSAYGYVQEADRSEIETRLARHEAHIDEERRFDIALDLVGQMRIHVDDRREERKRDVRRTLAEIVVDDANRSAVLDIEKALDAGDIATANELVDWLQQGNTRSDDLNDEAREGFSEFFPASMVAINDWLEKPSGDPAEVIRRGSGIPGMQERRIDDAQREQAAAMFSTWEAMKQYREAEFNRLGGLFRGLGLTVKTLRLAEKVAGREVWMLDAEPLGDRHICALPMFGSAAGGRYRVICVWGRPTEDELLQWVGDVTAGRPAILLYFGRMTERKWRELGRMAKAKRRSFLFLDETLLAYLCGAAGSRLRAWFDAALPFTYSSPYDATAGLVPPEMFYGRAAELDAVLGTNGRCFIYGGRQLGKTALLKRAEQSFHSPKEGRFARWIDLRAEGIGVSVAASEIWGTLHERFRELQIIDTKSSERAPTRKAAEKVVRAIREFLAQDPDLRILLLLDEADRFFEQDGRNDFEETRRLKQLMDDTQRHFKVVFAGLHNVLRMTERPNHPLAHFGEPIEIGPLREGAEVREAAKLIRRPMEAAGFQFESRHLVIRILAQTNYYPSLIQLYCSHLLKHMLSEVTGSRSNRAGPRYLVTDRDIEQVYSSDALRDEIRSKFRLTLQLDPRYEVLAYAMGLALLRGEYSQTEGMQWQTIRQTGALHWWAEGFHDTAEADFQVLLEEMVLLGVLRSPSEGRYVLRNPNVLLLLGTRDEMETVLAKERESAVEFESASFRPALGVAPQRSRLNVFTYQQLSGLFQRKNDFTVVTGTPAAGIDSVILNLQDYQASIGAGPPVLLDGATDRAAFASQLQKQLAERIVDQVSVFVVPDSIPWTDLWLKDAHALLRTLRSESKFASLVFVAEPATLWRLLRDTNADPGIVVPWMSLMHWSDGFLRHWLDESQLHLEREERGQLVEATGLWPALIEAQAGDRPGLRVLRDRIAATAKWPMGKEESQRWRERLGLDVAEPAKVLDVLARLGEPATADDLALVGEFDAGQVGLCLRWAELLGLARREGAGYWMADPVAAKVFLGAD